MTLVLAVVVIVLVACGLAVVSRLSQESLAMLVGGGAVLAVLVVLLAFVLVGFWIYLAVRRRRRRYDGYQVPPIVIQQPQQPMMGSGYGWGGFDGFGPDPLRALRGSRREITVVGEDK